MPHNSHSGDTDIKISRDEMAMLLSAAQTGAMTATSPDTPAVEPFDFRRPETISKEFERTLNMVYNSLARQLAGSLSTLLRGLVSVDVMARSDGDYQRFLQELPEMSLMAVCGAAPLEGKILVTVDPLFCMFLVDRLLGGPGYAPREARSLTEIETVLMRQVVQRVLTSLREALQSVVDINPNIDQLEANPVLVQLVPGATQVFSIKLAVTMRTVTGYIRICIPFQVLKPMLPLLHEHFWMQGRGSTQESGSFVPTLGKHLSATAIDLSLELGSATITLGELLELADGDCVVLDHSEMGDLPVKVSGRRRLRGRLGVANGHYAVAITGWDENGLEDNDTGSGSDDI